MDELSMVSNKFDCKLCNLLTKDSTDSVKYIEKFRDQLYQARLLLVAQQNRVKRPRNKHIDTRIQENNRSSNLDNLGKS